MSAHLGRHERRQACSCTGAPLTPAAVHCAQRPALSKQVTLEAAAKCLCRRSTNSASRSFRMCSFFSSLPAGGVVDGAGGGQWATCLLGSRQACASDCGCLMGPGNAQHANNLKAGTAHRHGQQAASSGPCHNTHTHTHTKRHAPPCVSASYTKTLSCRAGVSDSRSKAMASYVHSWITGATCGRRSRGVGCRGGVRWVEGDPQDGWRVTTRGSAGLASHGAHARQRTHPRQLGCKPRQPGMRSRWQACEAHRVEAAVGEDELARLPLRQHARPLRQPRGGRRFMGRWRTCCLAALNAAMRFDAWCLQPVPLQAVGCSSQPGC